MTLRPIEFHILLSLAGDDRHGYAILQEVERLTGGELRLEPGTLYRALHRMLRDGWVAESGRRPAARDDDERRRYYRLTPLGRRVATAEADRLSRLVTVARTHRLLTHA
jgi:DNA-binding PadR family transcriptional regulator